VEPSARFEDVKIPLGEPVHGLQSVAGVLGIPEWWPTGARAAVVFAHGSSGTLEEPLLVELQRVLTERKYLTLRFNFPFAEAAKKRPDRAAVLERTMRGAIALLARDPGAAPAHLFVCGRGLGARVCADLAMNGPRVDGVMLLGYPLHPPSDPTRVHVEHLFRLVSPLLFVQGTRDRSCDIPTLRRTLTRVGAPTTLKVVQEADQSFRVPKKSGRTDAEVQAELVGALDAWMHRIAGE
jgi:predicted alpha/beta-hydrolase family hydrolase